MNLKELIAASEEVVNDAENLTTSVALHPETRDSQVRARKVKAATKQPPFSNDVDDEKQFENRASAPAAMSASTSVTQTTETGHDHVTTSTSAESNNVFGRNPVTNGAIPNTNNALPNSHGSAQPSSTTRVEKRTHRECAERDLPTGPPADILHDLSTESFSLSTHSWPIAFAIIPPMAALVYGKSDVWSDFLLLLLIAYYLYNIIKGEQGLGAEAWIATITVFYLRRAHDVMLCSHIGHNLYPIHLQFLGSCTMQRGRDA
jgi:hypothetical protein